MFLSLPHCRDDEVPTLGQEDKRNNESGVQEVMEMEYGLARYLHSLAWIAADRFGMTGQGCQRW